MSLNMRSIMLIGVALLIAGVTAILARNLLTPTVKTVQNTNTVEVVKASDTQILVASRDLSTGSFLKKDDLAWQSWPDDNVNENYIIKNKDVKFEDFAGAVVKSPMISGEPMTNSRIVTPGNRGFLAAVLTPGNRAVSIKINATSGISGFVFPDDRVDILLTHTVKKSNKKDTVRVTETVLKNVRVLAIDTRYQNNTNTPSPGKNLTIEVSPKAAEKVALAGKMGNLSLSLRSLARPETEGKLIASNMVEAKTFTRDNEVSQLMAGGGPDTTNRDVTVIRGAAVQERSFESLLKQATQKLQKDLGGAAADDEDIE